MSDSSITPDDCPKIKMTPSVDDTEKHSDSSDNKKQTMLPGPVHRPRSKLLATCLENKQPQNTRSFNEMPGIPLRVPALNSFSNPGAETPKKMKEAQDGKEGWDFDYNLTDSDYDLTSRLLYFRISNRQC